MKHDNKGVHRPATHDASDSRPVPVTVTVDMPKGFRESYLGPTKDAMQEAEALLALEAWVISNHNVGTNAWREANSQFEIDLRNRAPALIRALMERVRILEEEDRSAEAIISRYKILDERMQARIESLEAERELGYERFHEPGVSVPRNIHWPTSSEIAARVAQKRKEQSSGG